MNINADEVSQEYVMSKFASERDLRAAMVAEIVALRMQIAATQPPQDERWQEPNANPWRDLFWSVARVLNCLPSTFVDGNEHVYKQAEKYAILAASAPAQQAGQREVNLKRCIADDKATSGEYWKGYAEGLAEDFDTLAAQYLALKNATTPQPVAAEELTGDALIRSAQALLNLDADGALVPHGIGGHARTIIQAFINQRL